MKEQATLDNTIFYSVAKYPDLNNVVRFIKKTADYFAIALQFPIFEKGDLHPNHQNHDKVDYVDIKIRRILPFLEQWKTDGKKYALYADARDVVFVDTAQNILDTYNNMNVSGVLFNADDFCKTWPCKQWQYTSKIVNQYGGHGVINAGLFIGMIDDIIELFNQILELQERFYHNDFSYYVFKHFNEALINDIAQNKDLYKNDDEYYIQLLQYTNSQLIQTDKDKLLLGWFRDCFPLVHDRQPRRTYCDHTYIGTAKVLHCSRFMNTICWDAWINEEILRIK